MTRGDVVACLVLAAILVLAAGTLLSTILTSHVTPRTRICGGQLRDLYNGVELYMLNHGDERWHPPWLTLLADLGYYGALRDDGGRGPSDPAYDRAAMRSLFDESLLICPSDRSRGQEGGRPDRLLGLDGLPLAQFPRADVDLHAGPPFGPDAPHATLDGANRVPTSYLYEFGSELCDRLYPDGAAELKPPTDQEFEGVAWTKADVLRLCDEDGDGSVSWRELRRRSVRGRSDVGLQAWGTRVPVLRCYWHARGGRLTRDSDMLLATYGGDFAVVRPAWYWD